MLTLLGKLRSVHQMPRDLAAQIENAISGCKPPEVAATVVDERSPMQRCVTTARNHRV